MFREEQEALRVEQTQSRQDATRLVVTVRDLATTLIRRPAETEVPVETTSQDRVPPPPPPAVHYPEVPTAPPLVVTYELPPPQMPMGPTEPLFRPGGSVRAEQEQPKQFYVGESSRT